MKYLIGLLSLVLLMGSAAASWTLDNTESSIKFISIKTVNDAETHTFKTISGSIDSQGNAQVLVQLDSVDTLNPLRDDRIRSFLFQTSTFPQAILSTRVDPVFWENLKVGDNKLLSAEGVLSLHGATQNLALQMRVARVSENEILVAAAAPIIIQTGNFGLDPGLEKLRQLAGLASISKAVPITFALTFKNLP